MRVQNFRCNECFFRKTVKFRSIFLRHISLTLLRFITSLIFSAIIYHNLYADTHAASSKVVSFADDSGNNIIVDVKGALADVILDADSQIKRKSEATKLYKKMFGASYGRFIVDGRAIYWQGANLYVRDGDFIRVFQSEAMGIISKKWIALEKIDKVSVEQIFSAK